jgi:riboflavin biosynthesis pyrimidine reductase
MQCLGMFSEGLPLSEVEDFYSLSQVISKDEAALPFIWCMSVCSLDGRISYGPGTLPPSIALAGVPEGMAGAAADWRLLQAGWATADAVLISGSCLRNEPETSLRVTQEDLIDMRVRLGHKHRQPMRIILTSGNVDPSHILFRRSTDDSISLVATTFRGLEIFKSKLRDIGLDVLPVRSEGAQSFVVRCKADASSSEDPGIKIVVVQEEGAEAVSYPRLLNYLRRVEGIRYLDVSAGGVVIGAMMAERLIDEMRLTLAGNLVGSGAPLISFPSDSSFKVSPDNSPLVSYDRLRSLGAHHLYLRGKVIYRH